ncbi:unnamed protein product [Ectocarpus sp. CCAP 1310/34]|nr:unnamed protein product [Ectocarpus sp. CCAP 1310/34]
MVISYDFIYRTPVLMVHANNRKGLPLEL